MTDISALKRQAAEAALAWVRPGEIIGIGTGSTTNHFIDLLGERFPDQIPGAVSSSIASSERLAKLGIPVLELPEVDRLYLYVDGADTVAPDKTLIKGGGGALTREKIVASASKTFVCIVDEAKLVERHGRFPLPVEVIPMAQRHIARALEALGARPVLRDFVTDNGNLILDCHGLVIDEPHALESHISTLAGVVTCGIFAHRSADVVLVATPSGVVEM